MIDKFKRVHEIDPRDDYYSRTMETIRALRRQGKHQQADDLMNDLKALINNTTKWERR